jgi:DMSO/TMAO reductase YedYZ molybdopterin-dependent catalytic subunit
VRRFWSIMLVCLFDLGLCAGMLWPGAALAAEPTPTPTSVFDVSAGPPTGYSNASTPDEPVLLRQAALGAFEADVQQAFGNVQHRRLVDREVLRLAPNFKVQPGPALDLVLTQSATPSRQDIRAATRLAELKSREGAQEYDLPTGQDFGAVVLYAREKDLVFAIAHLEPKPVCSEVPNRGSLALLEPATAPTSCLGINTIEQLNLTGTPPKDFDINAYRLVVKGEVDNPLSLSYEDLKKLPAISDVSLLICSGVFADVAEWTGVSLSNVLEQAKLKPDWKTIRLESVDGYFSLLDRDKFKPEDVLLAYQVNGEPLPVLHGFPLRLALKGEYGSKWVKWLGSVQVLNK